MSGNYGARPVRRAGVLRRAVPRRHLEAARPARPPAPRRPLAGNRAPHRRGSRRPPAVAPLPRGAARHRRPAGRQPGRAAERPGTGRRWLRRAAAARPDARGGRGWGRRFGSASCWSCCCWWSAFGVWVDTSLNRVEALPADSSATSAGTNWLIVGSDSRAGLTAEQEKELATGGDVGQRTDTIMLLHSGSGGRRRW